MAPKTTRLNVWLFYRFRRRALWHLSNGQVESARFWANAAMENHKIAKENTGRCVASTVYDPAKDEPLLALLTR